MKKRIIGSAIAVIVIAAGAWAAFHFFNKKDTQLTPSLNTTPVRKGTIEVKVSGTGSIQPSDREKIKASKAGTVLKAPFKEGDTVKKGDILVSYEEDDVSSQIRSKEIDLKKKQLDLNDLQTRFKQAPDDETRESLALNIQKQQLDIESTKEDIANLKTSKSIDPIVAPISGLLTTFTVKPGDTLNPNAELGEIVDYSQMKMVVGIDELDISKVQKDLEAEILVEALPNEKFTGKVVSIADEGTTSNGVASFDVTIALAEAKNLKVGMSAEASIMTAKKEDVLYVPVEAVQSAQGKYFVLVPSTTGQSGQAAQDGQTGRSGQSGQGQQGQWGQRGQGGPGGMPENFQNMTEEERAAMREQFMSGRGGPGTGNTANSGTTNATTTTRVEVEVGINNENSIEIVSGLKAGDMVVLPTVKSSSSSMNMPGGLGIGGAGGFPSGGGGAFQGGGTVRQFTNSGGARMGGGR
ncbi:efflux RND transporter periplasmic adaptor subunit [Cohnella terricola]|uniref:Efflux RND transporter periplasmic adaptor subunit n=1 Tax=Cohnella terricola TaxID=1289167 RepID=A0A559JQV9_9BACL|nr:efflux RND transporter periplasmic adaptor subunit [Cohnella terricola]TVY02247.1 efflux RND transporter periplasmic adaptor subunit [Cohnella terricola]